MVKYFMYGYFDKKKWVMIVVGNKQLKVYKKVKVLF